LPSIMPRQGKVDPGQPCPLPFQVGAGLPLALSGRGRAALS